MIRSRDYWENNLSAAVVICLAFLVYTVGWVLLIAALWHAEWMHAFRLFLVTNVGYGFGVAFTYVHWLIGFLIICGMVVLYFHA